MKNTLKIAAATLIAAAIAFSACRKNYNSAGATASNSIYPLYAGLVDVPQNFSVQAGRDTVIYAAQGTMLHFYPYSFKTAQGSTVTSGQVNMQITEMYTPGSMIANRTSTVSSDGRFMKSAGEINITAFMNGTEIFANKYGVGFPQKTGASQAMQLFYGSATGTDSVASWTQCNTSLPGTTAAAADSFSLQFYGYNFDSCANFHLVNCDYFDRNTGAETDVNVVLPDTSFNAGNTQVFIVFPTYYDNSAIPVTLYNSSTNNFSLDYHGNTIGVGYNYELAVIAYKNGVFYYYQTSGTTTSGMTIHAVPVQDSRTDIKTKMLAL